MHQSSFRILRWTDDDRPFTKDFQDLFCTLMVALPLGTHRYRLSKHRQTFTTGEALNHLGNLRFTQSNRRPSPNDPNVMVTTKIATTFSMVAPMARSLCNKFLAARLVESVEGKAEFSTTDSIWQLTSKGIKLLENFAHRNGVQERHVFEVLNSARNRMNLLVLERDSESDALSHDRATAEVIFRRFIGSDAPNTAGSVTSTSDTDVISDSNGQIGVRLTFERIFGLKSHKYTFSGSDAIRWLMECCTLVDVREAEEICSLFIDFQFIKIVAEDKPASRNKFPYTKGCYYKVSDSGIKVAHWNEDWVEPVPEKRERSPSGMKESNTNRMNMIVTTPSLRLMFRQYLKDTHCEENLVFFLEVKDFLGRWSHAVKRSRKDDTPALDTVRETLAAAYDLYNAFLAPGSPCELNIDHNLRNALVSRMTRFELPDDELLQTVREVIQLYDQAQNSVFKLMASDSVPKFLRDQNYRAALAEYHAKTAAIPQIQILSSNSRADAVAS